MIWQIKWKIKAVIGNFCSRSVGIWGKVNHFLIATIVVLFVSTNCGAQAFNMFQKPVNVEMGHVWSNGILNDKLVSTAFRFGVSGNEDLSLHSSLDFGFLENDRRKYIRFNIAGYGIQPKLTQRWSFSGFFRGDILCLTIAETGYMALTPSIEFGAVTGIVENWAALFAIRHSVDFSNPHSSLTSFFLGLVFSK